MKRFIFLAILCSLALGMGAQTAKEEIFADVHRTLIKECGSITSSWVGV